MPTSSSPYTAFAALLASSGHPVSPAELHGLLLGRSCAGAGFAIDAWLVDAAAPMNQALATRSETISAWAGKLLARHNWPNVARRIVDGLTSSG